MASPRKPDATSPHGRPKRFAYTFSATAIFLGCVATAFVFMALVFFLVATDPSAGLDLLGSEESAARIALSTGGLALVVTLVVGPTLAFGVSYLLRREQQVSRHLIAFGAVGLLIGFGLGLAMGGPALAMTMAPMYGVSAAAGRVAIQPLARV